MEQNLARKKNFGKGFIQRDHRGNLILFLVLILIALIAVAILSLLPTRYVDRGNSAQYGMGRESMFPFVFSDGEGTLRVIRDESLTVYEIDDSVSQSVHDSKENIVYYVRKGFLYQYEIEKNMRKELTGDVASFVLTENRNSIFVVDLKRNIKMYDGKTCVMLSKEENLRPEIFYSVGKNEILFLEDYRQEDGTARLCKADDTGDIKRYDFRVDAEKNFAFSIDGKKICYYRDNAFCVAKENGTTLATFANAVPVYETPQATLPGGTTETITFDDSMPVHYIVTSLELDTDKQSSGELIYFDGAKSKKLSSNIEQILYYSHERDMILYTGRNKDGSITVYHSTEGSTPEAQLSCSAGTKFLFDEQMDYLYYQMFDGTLYRYNIYDVNRKSVKVAENTGLLYLYPNKPFIAYSSKDSAKLYLVHCDNAIYQYEADGEWRMYGRDHDAYVFLRSYGANRISLDYVKDGLSTRLCGDVEQQVFFDKDLSYVFYTSGSVLFSWHNQAVVEIGNFGSVVATPVN